MANAKFLSKEAISLPAPKWATWLFRTVFILTTVASVWTAATGLITEGSKAEIMLGFKCLDLITWGIGRGLGVKKSDFGEDKQ